MSEYTQPDLFKIATSTGLPIHDAGIAWQLAGDTHPDPNFARHIARHLDGVTPGSQFNPALFADAGKVMYYITEHLPPAIAVPSGQDEHRSIMFTFDVEGEIPAGTVGVLSREEVAVQFPGREITRGMRIAGGEATTLEISPGRQLDVYRYEERGGNRFELPVHTAAVGLENLPSTRQISCVLVASPGDPWRVISAFPGSPLPSLPGYKIDAGGNIIKNTLGDEKLVAFWNSMVFLH